MMFCPSRLKSGGPNIEGAIVLDGPGSGFISNLIVSSLKDRKIKSERSKLFHNIPSTRGKISIYTANPEDRSSIRDLAKFDALYVLSYPQINKINDTIQDPQHTLHSLIDYALAYKGTTNKTHRSIDYLKRSDVDSTIAKLSSRLCTSHGQGQLQSLMSLLLDSLNLESNTGVFVEPRITVDLIIRESNLKEDINELIHRLKNNNTSISRNGSSLMSTQQCANCSLLGGSGMDRTICRKCIIDTHKKLIENIAGSSFVACRPHLCDSIGPVCKEFMNQIPLIGETRMACMKSKLGCTMEEKRQFLWSYGSLYLPDCGTPCPFPKPKEQVRGLSYNPFRTVCINCHPVCPNTLATDLNFLGASGCRYVRTYGVTSGLEFIPKLAKTRGIKTFIGCNVIKDITHAQYEIKQSLELAKETNNKVVVVGDSVFKRYYNDALLQWNFQNREDVISSMGGLIKYAVNNRPNGIQLAYADSADILIDPLYDDIIGKVDVILVNVQPFWDKLATTMENWPQKWAEYTIAQIYKVRLCWPTKQVMLGECGYPTNTPRDKIIQQEYLEALLPRLEDHNIFGFVFEAFDQPWRAELRDDGNEGGQNCGLWTLDRVPKRAVTAVSRWLKGYWGGPCPTLSPDCIQRVDQVRKEYPQKAEYYQSKGLELNNETESLEGNGLDRKVVQNWLYVNEPGVCPLPCGEILSENRPWCDTPLATNTPALGCPSPTLYSKSEVQGVRHERQVFVNSTIAPSTIPTGD